MEDVSLVCRHLSYVVGRGAHWALPNSDIHGPADLDVLIRPRSDGLRSGAKAAKNLH